MATAGQHSEGHLQGNGQTHLRKRTTTTKLPDNKERNIRYHKDCSPGQDALVVVEYCPYNANVRVGDWYYDLVLQEEKCKQYMRKTQSNELNVQRTRLAFLYMLREIPLSFPVLGLTYGAVIQIVSPEMPTKWHFKVQEKQGILLGADIHYSNIAKRIKFASGDIVIGTGLRTPCARNVWTLVPWDDALEGKQVRFGESFALRLFGSETPLYLECPLSSPFTPKGESGHVIPKLTYWKTILTRFKVVHSVPSLRFETEGTSVQPNENIALLQAANGQCLGVEPDTWFPTYFGMECEVSVHTWKSKPETTDPRNSWQFILSTG